MAGPMPGPPSLMAQTYTEEDLLRWMDAWTLEKSERCLSGVRNMHLTSGMLIAEVKGSARYPYRVEIDLEASLRHPRSRLQSECSCPVGRHCKHVAAVLVAHMLDAADLGDDDPASEHEPVQSPRRELLEQLSRWQSVRTQPPRSRRSGIIFELSTFNHRPSILLRRVKYALDDTIEFDKWQEITPQLLLEPPAYLTQADLAAVAQLWALHQSVKPPEWFDVGTILQSIVSSGHGWVSCGMHDRVPARPGAPRRGTLGWSILQG